MAEGKEKELEIIVTTKKMNPLLKFDWIKKTGNSAGHGQNRSPNTPSKTRSR